MADRNIARRYAQAFLATAVEAEVIDVLDADLGRVMEEFGAHDGLLFHTLSNPVFTREERVAVLEEVLPRLEVQSLTANLLRLLLERGRFGLLPEIGRIYSDTVLERAGKVKVQVATAEPLTPALEAEVRLAFEKTTGKTVILETRLDPSLIGGMVARVGGKVYDSSIRSRLDELKHQLITATAPADA